MQRSLDDLRSVLLDPNSQGPSPVYTVTPANTEGWVNQTTIEPGKLGEEFTKTFGHYHTVNPQPELYRVLSGNGVLILQKKHIKEGEWTPEKVDEVLIVKASAGDQLLINPEYGHSWTNAGSEPLVLLDNWSYGHSDEDYVFIEKHKGMAYYIVDSNGQPQPVPNQNYKDLPQPIWATPDQLPQSV